MNIQVFQHVSFEGPACIEEIAKQNSYNLSVCRFDLGDPIPSPNNFDMLIIVGGPMSVNEESKYPWLLAEKKAIEQAIRENKIIFGFCLGAQLIADVLGAKVYKNKEKEIGWFPVYRTHPGEGNLPLQFLPDIATVFHWHGETFDIPANAVHLYESEATENQAFLYGKNTLALQFHPEMLKHSIEDLVQSCKSDLNKGRYVMSAGEIIENYSKYKASNKKIIENLFRYFVNSR